MAWLLNTKDKVDVRGKKGKRLYCPPHCIPHKLPFTKPIIDEPCHYHNSKWRMFHHILFCYLFCLNYPRMIEKYKEDKKKLSELLEMRLHEMIDVEAKNSGFYIKVQRVAGGWVYIYGNGLSVVFVPLSTQL